MLYATLVSHIDKYAITANPNRKMQKRNYMMREWTICNSVGKIYK